MSFGFGQQQHLGPQLFELGDEPVSFAGTGQVAHALVRVGGGEIALEEEVDAVKVLGSAHEEGHPRQKDLAVPRTHNPGYPLCPKVTG